MMPKAKHEIPTPALVIDMDAMEGNIARMAAWFRRHREAGGRAQLRPHVKAHKTPILAHKQLAVGEAVGITCAKLGEALVMSEAGIRDILIANQIVDRQKIYTLAGLARHARLTVALDTEKNAKDLARACRQAGAELGVLVEVDVGLHRCGLRKADEAVRLAKKVSRMKGLAFRGLQGFEGHLVFVRNARERRRRVRADLAILAETQKALEQAGLPVEIVSGGSTGTYDVAAESGILDEVQAGSYLFMDTNYRKARRDFDPALRLLTTLVSIPDRHTIIVDCGLKSLTSDEGSVPLIEGLHTTEPIELHEEHAIIRVRRIPSGFRVGNRLSILPGHVCTTVNLHDRYYGLRDDRVEVIWPIAARGRFD